MRAAAAALAAIALVAIARAGRSDAAPGGTGAGTATGSGVVAGAPDSTAAGRAAGSGTTIGAPTDPVDAAADRAYHDAAARGDLDALERLGHARPITRWTDNAWAEVARLAVRAGDISRARAALAQVIATSTEPQMIHRARTELARLDGVAGAAGEWAAVAAAHERLVPALHGGGDPGPALAELERLVEEHAGYPRAPMLMVAIASGWEREGDAGRAIAWLVRAKARAVTPTDRLRAHADLIRTLIRARHLAQAEAELAALAPHATRGLIASLQRSLDRAELRRTARWIVIGALAALIAAAAVSIRRATGSWRAVLHRIARPPPEVYFLVPVAAVLIFVAYTGNPLVARAVAGITAGGVATCWLSGVVLDARGRVGGARAFAHVALVTVAIAATTFLAVDRDQLVNFVIETWRAGPNR